ncbi:5947_t:CDS:2 [Scutellospora calospora]|uniref:5947_t:CDS:1 n=1 Tax=Scutellospora calospora TaxID=85575 RepID=A0ACA9JVZ5_9GLOM|nr:5947_t:CDS:2 [Scutellospora calospora]
MSKKSKKFLNSKFQLQREQHEQENEKDRIFKREENDKHHISMKEIESMKIKSKEHIEEQKLIFQEQENEKDRRFHIEMIKYCGEIIKYIIEKHFAWVFFTSLLHISIYFYYVSNNNKIDNIGLYTYTEGNKYVRASEDLYRCYNGEIRLSALEDSFGYYYDVTHCNNLKIYYCKSKIFEGNFQNF